MDVSNSSVQLNTSDGKMNAYVAQPKDGGSYPGIVVIQEAFGVNDHMKKVTDRIAAEGYVAICPDIFHREAERVIPFSDMAKAIATLQRVQELDPDVVVMDISMPGMSGLSATRVLKEARPRVAIVVLTRHADDAYLHEMLRAGAAAFENVARIVASEHKAGPVVVVSAMSGVTDTLLNATIIAATAGAQRAFTST